MSHLKDGQSALYGTLIGERPRHVVPCPTEGLQIMPLLADLMIPKACQANLSINTTSANYVTFEMFWVDPGIAAEASTIDNPKSVTENLVHSYWSLNSNQRSNSCTSAIAWEGYIYRLQQGWMLKSVCRVCFWARWNYQVSCWYQKRLPSNQIWRSLTDNLNLVQRTLKRIQKYWKSFCSSSCKQYPNREICSPKVSVTVPLSSY